MNANTRPTLANVGRVHSNILIFRCFNYLVLVTLIVAEKTLNIKIPEGCYLLSVFAVLGGDLQLFITKFFRIPK